MRRELFDFLYNFNISNNPRLEQKENPCPMPASSALRVELN
jgi:hypothetical protein